MANDTPLNQLIRALIGCFCGGNNKQDNYQNQQQQQQQQQQGYPGLHNNQQQAYPPLAPPGQQTWAQAAGGHSPPYQQQQQHHQQHQYHGNQQQHHGKQHGQNGFGQHQQQHRPQGLPAGGIVGPHHPAHQDDNQINQANQHYVQLRNQARHEGDEAHRCFAASQQAYQSGDGARAHDLSVEGKKHAQRQDELDDQASSWIFVENNRDSPPGTLDLHGLYVKEAIERTEQTIREAQSRGDAELRVIVGKGIHSQGHVQRIRPAVEDLMRRYNLSAHIDPRNTGVLIVDLNGNTQNGRTRDAGGLVDQMERDEGEGCTIM